MSDCLLMMLVVNTWVNEVNHRLIVSRLPGRLGKISCWRCNWLVWKAGVSSICKCEKLGCEMDCGRGGRLWDPSTGPVRPFPMLPGPWAEGQGMKGKRCSSLSLGEGAKRTHSTKGALWLSSRAFSSNLILKVIGGISVYGGSLA